MIKIKLRELLWEKNLTAVKLHQATGIGKSKISEIVRGKRTNITLDTVDKICTFLDCKIEDLIEITK